MPYVLLPPIGQFLY